MERKSKIRANVMGEAEKALRGLACCAIVGMSLVFGIARADYGGGDGTADNPYIIRDEVQMNSVGANPDDWDKHFRLASDIDLGGYHNGEFNIIGNEESPFTGVFDGNDHVISNFSYTCVDTDSVGLFGCISHPASIEGLQLVDPNIDAGNGDCIGGLVGRSETGGGAGKIEYPYIINCRVVGGVIKGNNHVGAMIGSNKALISESYCIAAEVHGNENVGGFAGTNHTPICYVYSICSVSGNNNVGGLVGHNLSEGGYDYEGISNCYSAGQVSGTGVLGGFVALNEGTVGNCFWDIDVGGIDYSDGGIAKPTVEMMDIDTYEVWACDFMWTIDNGNDYPRLAIEGRTGELIEPTGYSGGTGEPNDPYQIYTAEDLDSIGRYPCHSDKHFVLMNDIDLSGYTGISFHQIRLDYGSFEGNNHVISNYNYRNDSEVSPVGLFNSIQGDLKNLVVVDPNINAPLGSNVGALVGWV